jgi:two-component system OmpR family response regulator
MRVLIVEDDPALSARLKEALAASGFIVDHAPDGEEAQYLGENEAYDAALLDLGLPKLDGVSVLQSWREAKRTFPVLALTARGRWSDKLSAFNAGADDYLVKPFEIEEVIVRLRALIRRSAGHAAPVIECGALRLDTASGSVAVDGQPVKLTAQELRILSYLAHHQGRLIGRSELVDHVYERDGDRDSNVIDVLIARIRRKLGAPLIHTSRGQGYMLAAEPPS